MLGVNDRTTRHRTSIEQRPKLVSVDDVRLDTAKHLPHSTDSPEPEPSRFVDAADLGSHRLGPFRQATRPFQADDRHPLPETDSPAREVEHDALQAAQVQGENDVSDPEGIASPRTGVQDPGSR
jgi:hypothetical protein